MFKKIVLWICVILLSAVIFGFSSENGEESSRFSEMIAEKIADVVEATTDFFNIEDEGVFEKMHYIVRKGAHFTEFALLGILSFLLAKSYDLSVKNSVIAALSYCLLFAICDEIHQLFVDGRVGSVTDVCIDFVGSCFGVAVFLIILCHKKAKKI